MTEVAIPPKPNKPCPACNGNSWWPSIGVQLASWHCVSCFPNPNEPSKEEKALLGRLKEEQKQFLMSRIKTGNDKLWEAMLKFQDAPPGEGDTTFLDKHREKVKLLQELCAELIALGFNDCLYIENGKRTRECLWDKSCCYACPAAAGGGRKYWEEELFEVKRKSVNVEKQYIFPFDTKEKKVETKTDSRQG